MNLECINLQKKVLKLMINKKVPKVIDIHI